MKRLLRNVTVFIAIFLVLNLVPHPFLSPYYGNKWYATKYEHYMKHHEQFNTVFWGSSRMERQVNPRLLNQAFEGYGVSVFNFGAPGTYNPEEYYLYEEFLDSIEKHPIQYAFLELQPIRDYADKNRYAMKSYYWKNLEFFLFSIRATLDSDAGLKRKAKISSRHGFSYLIRLLYGWKSLYASNKQERNTLWIGRNRDGFCPLDEQMEDMGGNNRLRQRLNEFLDDPSELKERYTIAEEAFSKGDEHAVNEAHLKKLKELINRSKQNGIHLVFIIPPRLGVRYDELLALKSRLPDRHIIELANPDKYPELYQLKYAFDAGHLNKQGSTALTQYLVTELRKHVFNGTMTHGEYNGLGK